MIKMFSCKEKYMPVSLRNHKTIRIMVFILISLLLISSTLVGCGDGSSSSSAITPDGNGNDNGGGNGGNGNGNGNGNGDNGNGGAEEINTMLFKALVQSLYAANEVNGVYVFGRAAGAPGVADNPVPIEYVKIWYDSAAHKICWYSERNNTVKLGAGSLENLFQGCTGYTTISMDGIVASSITNMAGMFQGCTGLTNVDLTNFNASSATDLSNMFQGCTSLSSLTLTGFTVNTTSPVNMAGMFRDCSGLTGTLDLSSFDTTQATDMSYMFCGCRGLTGINFGSSFHTANVTDMSYMFSSVESGTAGGSSNKMNLESLDVSGFYTSKVTNMSHMFYMCSNSNLTTLDVSGFNTSNVTDMSYMFGCWKDAPSYVTAFNLSNWDFSKVTSVANMFSRCQYAVITFPPVQTKWSRIEDMLYMFSHCFRLTRDDLKTIIKSWDFSEHNNPAALSALFANATDSDTNPETEPSNRIIGSDMKYDKHHIDGGADFDTRVTCPTHGNNTLITTLYVGGNISTYKYQRLTTVETP